MDAGDLRVYLAALAHRHHLGHRAFHQIGPVAEMEVERDPHHRQIADVEIPRLGLRDAPGGEADREDAPENASAPDRGIEEIAADRVEDDVDAAIVGHRVDLLAQGVADIAARQIDDAVGAMRLDQRHPLGRHRCRTGDRGRSLGLGDLDRREPHPTGGAEDQDRVAGGELGADDERDVRRQIVVIIPAPVTKSTLSGSRQQRSFGTTRRSA